MDHLEVLREKIARLRAEIAEIHALNQQYRLRRPNGIEAQVDHGQRQERLQAIQQELAQVQDLGRRVVSVERMKEKTRERIPVVKQAS
jgi:phosphoglycerate-specific signal transduction histidine kinase